MPRALRARGIFYVQVRHESDDLFGPYSIDLVAIFLNLGNPSIGGFMVLSSLGAGALDRLRQRGHNRIFKKKDVVFRFGDPGLTLLIVSSGTAEVSVTTALGQKSILGIAIAGDVLGDIACLDGGPRSADVVALEKMEAIEVQRGDVLQLFREDPDSAILVIEALCQKARNASEMFEVQTMQSGQARLAACLLRLLPTAVQNDAGQPTVKASQSWLGAYAGLTRENVNRQLKAWTRDGIARFEKGYVVIEDQSRLEDLAQGDDPLGNRAKTPMG